MKDKLSLSSLKRVFFAPVNQQKFDELREQHIRTMAATNLLNMR
ncbi:hypothetical protein [Specibacter cremeus]|nr:hypothetical protein [Specibacter cremeus]